MSNNIQHSLSLFSESGHVMVMARESVDSPADTVAVIDLKSGIVVAKGQDGSVKLLDVASGDWLEVVEGKE